MTRLEPNLSITQAERAFRWQDGLCLSCNGMTPTKVTSLGTADTALGPLEVLLCKWCLCYRVQGLIKNALEAQR